ncbi:MAG: PepSY domain-containing protein [Actinomycetota bacterium]
MTKKTRLILGAVAAVAVIGAASGFAIAAGGDEKPLRGNSYDRATAAALEHVGEGTVTETETGDGGSAYEVEVRRDDGSQVESSSTKTST